MPLSPFSALYAEHEVIMRGIDRLQDLLRSPDLSAHADEFTRLIAFFREYGDGYHHQKEEQVLFPQLRALNAGMEMLIDSLEDHHALFREELAHASQALVGGKWSSFADVMRQYAMNLADHISAENDELFVAAEDLMDVDDKVKMGHYFEDADRERGADRKRELEEIVV